MLRNTYSKVETIIIDEAQQTLRATVLPLSKQVNILQRVQVINSQRYNFSKSFKSF